MAEETAGIIGHIDELETLADALSGRLAIGAENAEGKVVRPGRSDDPFQSFLEGGVRSIRVRVEAERDGEVDGADENQVNALDAEDGIQVPESGFTLDLDTDEGLFIGGTEIFTHGLVKRQTGIGTAETALALGWEFSPGDNLFSFGGSVNHRSDNAIRACVEGALDVFDGRLGDADQRGGAIRFGDGSDHEGKSLSVDGGVLGVDDQPVEREAGEEAGAERAGYSQPDAAGGLTGGEKLLQMIGFHNEVFYYYICIKLVELFGKGEKLQVIR